MHLLIVGGTLDHMGGVEAFSERAELALEKHGDYRIARIEAATAYLTLRRLPSFIHGLFRLLKYRKSRPDCVWVQYVNLPDLCYVALAKLLRFRVLVTPHLGTNWRSQSNVALRRLSELLLRSADRLALISPTQEIELKLPAKLPRSHIRNFLPAKVLSKVSLSANKSTTALHLIHSGRLSAGKGTFLFVEVCRKLHEANITFQADITGAADDETLATLSAMISSYGLAKHVHVLGRISDEDLIERLSNADVLVHLSCIDSYPLIVLESLACSTLPVCMELAGARHMIETYDGFVVSQHAAVDETVSFLRTTPVVEIRQRAIAAGAKVRNDYSWSACAEALAKALKAAAG